MENTNELPKITLNDVVNMTEKDLKVKPKDDVKDGIIVDVELKTWKDVSKKAPEELKNPDGQIAVIKYESEGFSAQEIYAVSSNPSTSSKLGRFIVKYEIGPKPEMKIKVDFDEKSYMSIRIAK